MSTQHEPSPDRYDHMAYRRCGASGLRLPALSLGLWHNFGGGDDFETMRRMVLTARSSGASAKFAGSGGAIVGTYEDDAQYAALSASLAALGCRTIKPVIATKSDESADMESGAVWRNS